jgi:hypothetical protein
VTDELIKTRCVISIGDYDPLTSEQQYTYFEKGLSRFSQTWNVAPRYTALKKEADGAVAVWRVETKAPNWTVRTEFRLLSWSDIVRKDFRRWSFDRVRLAATALINFVTSGTCWHYFRMNWRFGLFFLYPVIAFSFFALVAFLISGLLENFAIPFPMLLGFATGAALFLSFIKWFDPVVLPRVVDMWIFMYELVHVERTNLAERLGVFSQDIIAKLESKDFDEIIIIGHGIGAVLQPIILDRALWALPEFGKDGRSVSVLSVGSLLLAVGLHPEGAWLVPPVLRISLDRMVYWAEYQAEEDVLSFPGVNPVVELLNDHGKPILQKIRIKDMIDPNAKSHFFESLYKNHRQFTRANTKRYFYDYFMICCGPFALSTRVKYPDLMVKGFGADGRLVADQ